MILALIVGIVIILFIVIMIISNLILKNVEVLTDKDQEEKKE